MESIIILGAGIMQIPAIKTAKELGLFVIAADKNKDAVGFKYADLALHIDTKDISNLGDFAVKNKQKFNIVGVFAAADNAISAAHINEALGLIGVSKFSAYHSNNKWLSKQLWLENNVPTPFGKKVKSYEEALNVIEKIGLPCMVKAVDSSASRGTQKLENLENLEKALNYAFNFSSTKEAIIEQYIEGQEYSVETVIYNDKFYRFGIAKREYDMLPLPIETGHVNPASIPKDIEEKMYTIVEKAALALKINNAPAKADIIVDGSGNIMILEMAARLSGGFHSQYTTPLSSGMNPIKFVMQLTIGQEPSLETYTQKYNKTAICRVIFPKPGYIKKIYGVDDAMRIENVNHIFLVVKEGDFVPNYKTCADRVCYVIVSANTYKEANHAFEMAKKTIKIITE